MKIQTRIFLVFLLSLFGSLFFVLRWINQEVKPRYRESTEEVLVDSAEILANVAATFFYGANFDKSKLRQSFQQIAERKLNARIYNLAKRKVESRIYITDRQGIVIFDSDSGRDEGKNYSRWNDVYLTLRGQYGARSTPDDPHDPNSTVLYVAAPILLDGQIQGVLTIGKTTQSANQLILATKGKVLSAGIFVAVVILVFGMLASLWIGKPIRLLTQYARALKEGKRVHLPELGTSEIGELGSAFEEMRDALEGKKYIETYVQTLTHEIKSPLSGIRGAVEFLNDPLPAEQRQRFISNIKGESQRIEKLVERLLQLSTLESRKRLENVKAIAASKMLKEVANYYLEAAKVRGVSLVVESDAELVFRGEESLISQALSNLVQNAISFAPVGSKVYLTARRVDDKIVIEVLDSGPGIPQFAIGRIFERFYSLPRPDTNLKSTGLGLSLVREVAALHQGDIIVTNRDDELSGTLARLILPL